MNLEIIDRYCSITGRYMGTKFGLSENTYVEKTHTCTYLAARNFYYKELPTEKIGLELVMEKEAYGGRT